MQRILKFQSIRVYKNNMNICSICVEQSKTNFYLEIIINFQEIDVTCMGELIQDWLLQESWIFHVENIYPVLEMVLE